MRRLRYALPSRLASAVQSSTERRLSCPRFANYLRTISQRTRTELPQIRTTFNCHQCVKGRHVGIMQWLLVWLIVNALFVMWRALETSYEMETGNQSVREMRQVADLFE